MQIKKGFTLVELAISLIIIGLVSGMGVTAIITTLAEKRRMLDVETELTKLNESFTNAIFDNVTRAIPSISDIQGLVQQDKRSNFVFKYNDTVTGDVCLVESSPCEVHICNNEACSAPAIINQVLYSVIELGPNKILDSEIPGSGNQCKVRINKFDRNNDDRVVYSSLRGVKNAVGCNKIGTSFYFLTNELPVFFRNSFQEDGFMFSVSPVDGVSSFEWKACMPTKSGYNNFVFKSGERTGNFYGYDQCNDINTPDMTITSNGPNVFLGKTSSGDITMNPGSYRMEMLVRYKDPSSGKRIGIKKEFAFNLADKE